MNSIIISLFVLLVLFFHLYVNKYIRLGKIKESLCAIWFMDSLLSLCGIVVIFQLYHYDFTSFLRWNNLLLIVAYLLITFLFLLLAPSGLGLLAFKKSCSAEELLHAEYRFNSMLCMVRNFLLSLLLFVPLFTHLPIETQTYQNLLHQWETYGILAGFYFTIFLLLFPMTLRQTFYWIKSLKQESSPQELQLIKQYSTAFRYTDRNFFV